MKEHDRCRNSNRHQSLRIERTESGRTEGRAKRTTERDKRQIKGKWQANEPERLSYGHQLLSNPKQLRKCCVYAVS